MEISTDSTAGGEAARDRASRRHRGLPVLPVLAVGLLAALAWLWLDTDRTGLPTGRPGLALPDEGTVAASYLDDGTPVFIARTDGRVEVFDARVPGPARDDDGRIRRLTVFCRSSGLFRDLDQGSVFGRDGRWNGGPAPASLATYPVDVVDGRVTVTGSPQERDRPGRSTTTTRPPASGPACTQLPAHERDEQLLHHTPDDTVPLEEVTGERWAWVEVHYEPVADAPQRVRVCDRQGCDPDTVTIPTGSPPDDGPALARHDEDDLLRLRRLPVLADG